MGPTRPSQLRSHPWDVLTLVWPVQAHVVWGGPSKMLSSCRLRKLVRGGCALVSGTVACCCSNCSHLPSLLQVTQAVPQTSRHLGWLSPCLVAALLPALLCGCLCGFAAGQSPPFATASSGLAQLAGHVGVFLGKPSGSSQAGSLAGAGRSASRRQPAKPCCESAWPINI